MNSRIVIVDTARCLIRFRSRLQRYTEKMVSPPESSSERERARLQAESHENRMGFLRTELALCSTFVNLAEKNNETGYYEDAQRYVAHAERGYSTVSRFLSDPKHSKHFSNPELHELTSGLIHLRSTLDKLKQR